MTGETEVGLSKSGECFSENSEDRRTRKDFCFGRWWTVGNKVVVRCTREKSTIKLNKHQSTRH